MHPRGFGSDNHAGALPEVDAEFRSWLGTVGSTGVACGSSTPPVPMSPL